MTRLFLFLFFATAAAQPRLQQYGVGVPTIKDIPVTVEASNETIQTTADGNRFVRKSASLEIRDSQGRVRRESEIGAAGNAYWSVTVQDPVAHVHLSWNTRDQLVTRTLLPGVVNLKVEPAKMQLLPVAQIANQREDLGTRIIAGYECTGTRTTITYPAGHFGNEKPYAVVNESWFSPQLRMTLEMKNIEPRAGVMTHHATKVTRGEPRKGLFEAPAGYIVTTVDLSGVKEP